MCKCGFAQPVRKRWLTPDSVLKIQSQQKHQQITFINKDSIIVMGFSEETAQELRSLERLRQPPVVAQCRGG